MSRRIFLSYGHDEYARFAVRLKTDLEARGDKVWFDLDRLRPGVDWERYIEAGIEWLCADPANARFLLLMTPHSVRRPDGFCLNELARAVSRHLPVIPILLASCEPPLGICRIQHLDLRPCVPFEQRAGAYVAAFERLDDVLTHGPPDFEGAWARLYSVLQPPDFRQDFARHLGRFTGRDWVLRRLREWLDDSGASRVFWITGDPGIGKSALACHIAMTLPEVAAIHICRHHHKAERTDPRHCVCSIAYQLSTQWPAYQQYLSGLDLEAMLGTLSAQGLFHGLLVAPFAEPQLQRTSAAVVLVDGLDEATERPRNELAAFLAAEFEDAPDWLRLLVTSRPEPEVELPLQRHDPCRLAADEPGNLEDLREFFRRELPACTGGGAVGDAIIEDIVRRSEGVFLYAEWVRRELAEGGLSLDRIAEFPRGLGSIYYKFFNRRFPDLEVYARRIRPVLELIAAAREPLELSTLCALLDDSQYAAEYVQHELPSAVGSLFPIVGGRIRPFHTSVIDWLTDPKRSGYYAVSRPPGHLRLARHCHGEFDRGAGRMSDYARAYAPCHLVGAASAECLDKLPGLLTDLPYVQARAAAGEALDLADDFSQAVASLPEEHPKRRILRLLDEALRRDGQFIHRHPTALFQCLWNSGWWYDSPEAAKHYGPAEGDWTPPWRQAGEKLSTLLERWLEAERRKTPRAPWLRSLRPPAIPLDIAQEAVLRGHEDLVRCVAFSPDGRHIVSGSSDRTVRIWNADTGEQRAALHGHEGWVCAVAFGPRARRIVSGSADGTVRLWDARTGRERAALRGHEDRVYGVAFSPDGRSIASGSADRTVRLWDAHSGTLLLALAGHEHEVNAVAFAPDARCLASGASDWTVCLWDADTGRRLAALRGHEGRVYGVAFSPDSRRIASASLDCTVRLWDAHSGKHLASLEGHEHGIRCVAFSPRGRRIATGSWDRTVRIWDADSGEQLTALRGHRAWVTTVAFSPDARRIASGSYDRTIRIWDADSGEQLAAIHRDEPWITRVAFSHDGRRAISRAADGTARAWDARTGECLEVQDGDQDALPLAAGAGGSPFAAIAGFSETVIEDTRTHRPIAWFPASLHSIAPYPSGRLWAGVGANHVYLFCLEGIE